MSQRCMHALPPTHIHTHAHHKCTYYNCINCTARAEAVRMCVGMGHAYNRRRRRLRRAGEHDDATICLARFGVGMPASQPARGIPLKCARPLRTEHQVTHIKQYNHARVRSHERSIILRGSRALNKYYTHTRTRICNSPPPPPPHRQHPSSAAVAERAEFHRRLPAHFGCAHAYRIYTRPRPRPRPIT